MTQKELTLEVIKNAGVNGIRTTYLTLETLKKGVSDGKRLARYLQDEGLVFGLKQPKDSEKTWFFKGFNVQEYKFNEQGQGMFL